MPFTGLSDNLTIAINQKEVKNLLASDFQSQLVSEKINNTQTKLTVKQNYYNINEKKYATVVKI